MFCHWLQTSSCQRNGHAKDDLFLLVFNLFSEFDDLLLQFVDPEHECFVDNGVAVLVEPQGVFLDFLTWVQDVISRIEGRVITVARTKCQKEAYAKRQDHDP